MPLIRVKLIDEVFSGAGRRQATGLTVFTCAALGGFTYTETFR
jgi:hypothetical protein